jgi:hypothetical protein
MPEPHNVVLARPHSVGACTEKENYTYKEVSYYVIQVISEQRSLITSESAITTYKLTRPFNFYHPVKRPSKLVGACGDGMAEMAILLLVLVSGRVGKSWRS